MRIVHVEQVSARGAFAGSAEWGDLREEIHEGIRELSWPRQDGRFVIRPDKHGNGVKPIKDGFVAFLRSRGWRVEERLSFGVDRRLGRVDAATETAGGVAVVEWETGNVSSSHRAVNKLCLALLEEVIIAGVLVLPTREFCQWLTDRVGNFEEIQPYFDLWRSIPIREGVLEVIAVEHDAEDGRVRAIPKGTDGRALR